MRYGHDQIADITMSLAKGIASFDDEQMLGLSNVILLLPEEERPLMYPLSFVSDEDKLLQLGFVRYSYQQHDCYAYGLLSEVVFSEQEGIPSENDDARDAYILVSAIAQDDMMIRLYSKDDAILIQERHLTTRAMVEENDHTRIHCFDGNQSEAVYAELSACYKDNLMPFSVDGLKRWSEKQRRRAN